MPIYTSTLSGSGTVHTVGATTFGSTLNVTGAISGSSTISGLAVTATSLNLQNGGITNAGAITGITNFSSSGGLTVTNPADFGSTVSTTGSISGSSTLQIVGAATFGTTIATTGSISGSSTLSCVGAITTAGGLNLQTSGITNAGAIAGATTVAASTSVKTPLIEYTDGDDAITIADGGGVTFSSTVKLVDDKTLTFGSNDDWTIEYDEDGDNDLVMTGTTFEMATDTATFTSANATDPLVIIKNTTNDTGCARLRFVKDKGAAGDANDDVGIIQFYGDDANQDQVLFGRIRTRVAVHTDGQEGGKMQFAVASHDGELVAGLTIGDGDAEDEVDVIIGSGADSLTTIAGDLGIPNGGFALGSDADGDVYYRNSGNLQRLAKGDDDQVLTLASGIPSWAAASAGSTFTNLSGSGILQTVGATILGSTLNVSGNVLVAGETHLSNSAGTEVLRIAKADGDTREIVFENEGTDKVSMYMNSAEHFFLRQHDAAKDIMLRMDTTNVLQLDGDASTAKLAWPLELGVDDTGVDFRIYSATTNEGVLYDASEDELALLLTTKLKFHDVGGGEEIFASADGYLEVNAGTTLDITAPTVDINASTAVTIDGPAVTIADSADGKPVLTVKTTHTTKTSSGELQFLKDAADTEDGEVLGQITFYGEDEGDNNTMFAKIVAEISESDETDEAGKLSFYVAESDGTDTAMTAGLVLEGEHATDGEVDATIGAGATSVTTVAGSLSVTTNSFFAGYTHYDSTPADAITSGVTATFTAGEDLEIGECAYFKSDGKMWKASASGAAPLANCVAMAAADISADATGVFLLKGFLREDTNFPTWTVGGRLFTPEAETSGKNVPEQTAPDTDGDFVQVIGWAVDGNTVYFDPDSTIIEVA